jgi:ribonuclease HI
MKFSAAIYGCVADKKTYSAVKITADKYAHKRVLALTKGTANQAELLALNYVLSAVKPEFNSNELEVMTSSAYILQMTDKNAQGVFTVSPEKNLELVQEVRNKLAKWAHVTVMSDKKSLTLIELKADVKAFK